MPVDGDGAKRAAERRRMVTHWRPQWRPWRRKLNVSPPVIADEAEGFDQYVVDYPSAQNAVDLVPGWSTALPDWHGVRAGAIATYNDHRIAWALEQFGCVQGKSVLELGPLEAGHTYMLEKAGASVEAIESNKLAFMRCLIFKEICGLTRSRFLLGDFVKWLDACDKTYDLIVASGVLYHMKDPLGLLERIAARAPAAFFWTHVLSEKDMPPGDPRRAVFAAEPEIVDFHGARVRAYRRTYLNAQINPAFCGGPEDEHRWLVREDLIDALRALGFTDIRQAHYQPNHQFGPAVCIFVKK